MANSDAGRKKRVLIIIISCLLAAALCLGAGVVGMRYLQNHLYRAPAQRQDADPAHALYQQKHPYIGRLPNLLVEQLALPNGLYHFGFQLHTTNPPYGFQQWLGADEMTYRAFMNDPAKQRVLQKNALIIMALIENCNYMTYSLQWSDERISPDPERHLYELGHDGFSLTYTKEWADAAIGGDIKAAAESEETFRQFLLNIDGYELPPAEPEMIGLDMLLRQEAQG